MSITIDGTTGISGVAGTASTPAVQGEDTNTGVFFPAADTVAVATAGTERLRVDSSGNVGIGRTPATTLDMQSAGNAVARLRSASGSSSGYFVTQPGADTTMMALADKAQTTGGTVGTIASLYTNVTVPLIFEVSASEKARIDASGNLLVGTTAVRKQLTVASGTDDGGAAVWNTSTANTTSKNPTMAFYSTDTVGTVKENATVTTVLNDANAVNAGIVFKTRGSDNVAERARIDWSGNLLVGQTNSGVATSPGRGLTLAWDGEIYATFNTAVAKNTYHLYNNNAINNGYRFYVADNGGIRNYSANNTNLSDERVKTDISPLGSYWDKIKAVQVVTYKYRDQDHGDDNIGVIAQQVETVAPEFVSNLGFGDTPADGIPLKTIYEADLHYATLKALQEAMARIEELTARVAELEAR